MCAWNARALRADRLQSTTRNTIFLFFFNWQKRFEMKKKESYEYYNIGLSARNQHTNYISVKFIQTIFVIMIMIIDADHLLRNEKFLFAIFRFKVCLFFCSGETTHFAVQPRRWQSRSKMPASNLRNSCGCAVMQTSAHISAHMWFLGQSTRFNFSKLIKDGIFGNIEFY